MKRKFFAIILLAMTIGFYSCQKEENNPIDNNANKGVKKMTPENEAIYNSIVDFREKLLKKDYKAGESISTEDAILLMEASLNLTYRHSDLVENKMRTIESSVSIDKDFSSYRKIEYSVLYKTYENILRSIRNVYSSVEEPNKKIRVIDLVLNENNTININTALEVVIDLTMGTPQGAIPQGSFDLENYKIEVAVHNRYAPNFMHAIYGIEFDNTVTRSDINDDERDLMRTTYYYNHDFYFVKNYFVNTFNNLALPYIILGHHPDYNFGICYSELEGIDNIKQWVYNNEHYLDKTLVTFELYRSIENFNTSYGWIYQTMINKCYADCVIWACPDINPLDISVDY